MHEVDQEIFDEWLGPRIDVKPIYDCKTLHESGGIAFELYKEAARVVAFAAHLLDDETVAKGGFARNQAICAGLMVNISKFMLGVIQLSTGDDRGEIVGTQATVGFGVGDDGDVVGIAFPNGLLKGYLVRHGALSTLTFPGADSTLPTMAVGQRIVGGYFTGSIGQGIVRWAFSCCWQYGIQPPIVA